MNNLKHENEFRFWLNHDRLPYEDICNLARGCIPTQLGSFGYTMYRFFNNCPFYSLLMSAISIGEIKSASRGKASPIECYLHFQSKGLVLPRDLNYLLTIELDEIQASLKRKVKRSTESYQRKEVRGDQIALEAVLKTLLDLYPDCPKATLISLKPVQEYANGHRHSDPYINDIISSIEKEAGKSRKVGNIKNEIKEKIEREIPDAWKPETCAKYG